ncbi:hypothetical protein CsNV_055 [Callinectes sapidus nudivirus]|nr:hypothetical protein CsNV_055 [Callinectes sapidus nudivirus]
MATNNVMSDDTSALRSHYYISTSEKSKYNAPIYLNSNKKVYIHKELRGFESDKFTHVNFLSLCRVLAFSYMRFKCTNIDKIIDDARSNLLLPADRTIVECVGNNTVTADGVVKVNQCVRYRDNGVILSLDYLQQFNAWPHDKPTIEPITEDANNVLFDYKQNRIDLHHFVEYINTVFKSNVSTILQNPIIMIFEEINIKYNTYRIFNNINLLAHDLFPSVYDFLTAQAILNYINVLEA